MPQLDDLDLLAAQRHHDAARTQFLASAVAAPVLTVVLLVVWWNVGRMFLLGFLLALMAAPAVTYEEWRRCRVELSLVEQELEEQRSRQRPEEPEPTPPPDVPLPAPVATPPARSEGPPQGSLLKAPTPRLDLPPPLERIDRWMGRYARPMLQSLPPGCADTDEGWPTWLRATLAWHDGSDGLAFLDELPLWTSAEIMEAASEDWLAFAGADGNELGVVRSTGVVEWRDRAMPPETRAPSFEAWLGSMADALEAGEVALSAYGLVDAAEVEEPLEVQILAWVLEEDPPWIAEVLDMIRIEVDPADAGYDVDRVAAVREWLPVVRRSLEHP